MYYLCFKIEITPISLRPSGAFSGIGCTLPHQFWRKTKQLFEKESFVFLSRTKVWEEKETAFYDIASFCMHVIEVPVCVRVYVTGVIVRTAAYVFTVI